jgi:hypothetical protein
MVSWSRKLNHKGPRQQTRMFVRLTDNEPESTVPENPPGTERLLVEAENVDQTTLEKCQIRQARSRRARPEMQCVGTTAYVLF